MINGDTNKFLKCVYDLYELVHIYNGKTFWEAESKIEWVDE